jgi:exodeoxyribonuclease VII small subunit
MIGEKWYLGGMAAKKPEDGKSVEKFEATLERLQELVRSLESGDCTLEDSIKKFEEGIALARSCQERLTQAEQKIEVLLRADKNGVQTALFESEG